MTEMVCDEQVTSEVVDQLITDCGGVADGAIRGWWRRRS